MMARLVTGIISGIVFLAAVFVPVPGVFTVMVGLVLSLAARELAELSGCGQKHQTFYVLILLIIYSLLCFLVGSASEYVLLILTSIALMLWLMAIPLLIIYPKYQSLFQCQWPVLFLGAILLLATAAGLVWLKSLPSGEWRVTLIVGLVAVADTCAYIAGKRYGRHKLAGDISPAKTIEGVIGGVVGNLLLTLVLLLIMDLSATSSLLLLALIMGANLLSIVGDLTESLIKRHSGVKDSGDILPGHGGLLDRVDGLLAATPFFVLSTFLFYSLS